MSRSHYITHELILTITARNDFFGLWASAWNWHWLTYNSAFNTDSLSSVYVTISFIEFLTLPTSSDTQNYTLYAPSYWATSSPSRKTRSSRSISSSMAWFKASRTVSCCAANLFDVEKARRVNIRTLDNILNLFAVNQLQWMQRETFRTLILNDGKNKMFAYAQNIDRRNSRWLDDNDRCDMCHCANSYQSPHSRHIKSKTGSVHKLTLKHVRRWYLTVHCVQPFDHLNPKQNFYFGGTRRLVALTSLSC